MSEDAFPKYSCSQQVGEQGVTMLIAQVAKMGWIFRRVPQEADFGIDGYMDLVSADGKVTGKTLAVQIKTGESYLSSKTDSGFVYKGHIRHLNLYMNHPVPVLLCICDHTRGEIWWEVFDPKITKGVEDHWSINIPFRNTLDINSIAALSQIAGPVTDHAKELKSYWAENAALQSVDLILLIIDKAAIFKQDIRPVFNFFQRLQATPELLLHSRSSVSLSVDGYDEDSKELWEFPEVRKWMIKAEKAIPHWFYFLSKEPKIGGLFVLRTSICRPKVLIRDNQKKRVLTQTNPKMKLEFLVRNFQRLNRFTHRHNIPESVNREISLAVGDYFGSFIEESSDSK